MAILSTPDLLGQVVLDRYRIVRRLASGGMGAVYIGRTEGAEGFARPVVIKRVLPGLSDDRELTQMLVREARILANLQHPNIVAVLDFGQHSDGAYLMVLEYVHGYELAQWHQFVEAERGSIPFELAIHIVCKVLDALHYAHTFKRADGKLLDIVHRDVTPTNVLLSEQATVKLLDFGIARVSGDDAVFLTDRVRLKGKLPYLPLEAFRGVEASVAGDVYSAGLTLYELLTSQNPFLGRDTADIYVKVLELTPAPVRSIRSDVPEALDAILARAMHKDPAQRYASAAEFALALRAILPRPDDAIAAELARRLSADFQRMPELLRLEPLSRREQAWRRSSEPPALGPFPPSEPNDTDPIPAPPEPNVGHDYATVRASIAPEILAAAKVSVLPKANPATARPAQQSLRRGLIIAATAAGIGAVAALAAWVAIGPQHAAPQRLVVIQRESATAQLSVAKAATAQAAPAPAAAPALPEPAESPPPSAAEVQAPSPAPRSAATSEREPTPAPEPDPKVLTRAFGRKHARVEECFHRHAAALPNLPQISIHFRVDERGEVAAAVLSPDEIASTALGRCLLDVARSTHYGRLRRAVAFHIPISIEKLPNAGG